MNQIFAFNKPFRVLSQFTSDGGKPCLAQYIDVPNIYCAGRLDYDSEGLLLLTDNGKLQHKLSHPKFGTFKYYWAQVEGVVTEKALQALRKGIELKDGPAKAHTAERLKEPDVWLRTPPIRQRANVPTSWVSLAISEGRNRQVRRMTAHIGYPTLRLIRHRIGDYRLKDLEPGQLRQEQ